MEQRRSKAEHTMASMLATSGPAPSELALDAIVAGVPVEETRPAPAGQLDVGFPDSDLPL